MGKSTAYYEQPTLWDRPLTQQEEERLHLVRAVWPEGVRTVLDVGCGNGALGNYLPEDAEVVGIDFSREALRHFRRRKILGLATCLPFSDEKFDLVICADTLEHLLPGEFERCTAELKRVARRFLLIISPQDEDLLANSTKCRYCGTLFHVNWHMRSLTKETIVHSFADLFSLRYFTFFGEKWLRRHPLVTKLHHSLAGRLSYWEDAVCPLCNVRQGDLPAPADDEKQVALLDDLEEICPLPSNACRENRCEILLLFERQGEQPENKADRPRQASAIILQPADGGEVTGRLIFRHRGTIEMDSPLCASPVTCFDPERAYLIVNEQMDWGRPYLLDDRWVRNYEDCGGKDAHAVCVFPRDVRGLRALIVSYKDTTAEPIHLQAYDPQQGYIQVGTLKGAGAGRWRKAIFPLPVHVRPGREGLIIHFVADGLSHPRDPHPIGSVEVLGATTQSIALALHPTVEDGKQSWVADYPHATCFSDREPVLKVNQPCLAKLGLPERERYLLGEGEELPIPMWLHEVLQGRAGYEVQERLEAEVARLRGELAEVRVMQEQEVARLQEALAASHQEAEASRLQLEQRGVEVSQIQAALRAAQAAQEQEVARLQEALAASHQEAEAARLQVEQQGVELSQIQAAQEQEVARLQEALAASHQEAEAARLQVEQQGVELSQIQAALRAAQAAQEQEVARLQEMLRQQEVEVVRLGRELARRAGWRGALREGLGFNNPHPSLLSRGIRRGVRTIRQIRRQFRSHQSVPYAPSFGSADKNRIVMLVPDNLIDRRVLLEGQALTQAGCEVTVIAAPAPENIPVDDADFPDLTIVRVNPMAAVQIPPELDCLNALPKRDWNDFYWLTDHYYLEAVTRPAEVYVAHDLPVLAAAAKAAAKHSAMLVYDAHELYPEQHVFSPTVKMMLADAEALLVPKVHHGTTVNLSLAQEMSKRYGGSPFEVILNAPAWPAEVMTQTHDSLRAALEIQPYHKVLLFQGGFSPYRNLENVVKAMARVRNEQIVLVLIGQGELRPELTEIAQRLGLLDSRVFFHPFVPQKSLLAYTRSADAGIIPYPHIDLNSYYCTPNKLFEYLVVGIPILANDSPELRRFVGELGVGLNVPMNDDCEIASGIDQLFSDSVLLKKFRIRSEEVGRQFTWEREAEKLRDLYASWIKEWCQTKRKLA